MAENDGGHNSPMIADLYKNFVAKYNVEPLIIRSPGRINLIGEHTDYNNGFVLPAAIDKAVYLAIAKREDNIINIASLDFGSQIQSSIDNLVKTTEDWPDYLLGVADKIQQAGKKIKGFDAMLTGDIPIGAGLSSSAAVECATCFGLNELYNLGLEKLEMVQLSQKAENEFVGVKCGIMDQFASMFGKTGHVIRLDCGSLEYAYFPFQIAGYKVVLLDTQVKHSLASSEYNTRRLECEQGVKWIQQKHPEVKTLRNATMQMLDENVKYRNNTVYKRCKYVVEEIARVQAATEDLANDRMQDFGKKMLKTHDGLSELYEVSCMELDYIVKQIRNNPNVLGCRMMGGGFGGCVISLVKNKAIDHLVESIKPAYKNATGLEMKVHIATIGNGTEIARR